MTNIALLSDFSYPNIGGVESHIYYLAYCLRQLGHKVIIVTRSRKDQGVFGVRYITSGIKVYYVTIEPTANIVFYQMLSTSNLLVRNIMIREQIQIVHGHQNTSTFNISNQFTIRAMGLPYIQTEHSLFDLHSLTSTLVNSLY